MGAVRSWSLALVTNTELKREYFPLEHQSVSPAFCPLSLTSWPSSHSHANALLSLPICEKLHWHDISLSLPALLFFPPVGIADKLDNINQLKVKGLVVGPLHTVQADRPETLDLQEINPIHGNKEALRTVIDKATRKGRISYSSLKLTQTFRFYDSYYAKNASGSNFCSTLVSCFLLHSRHLCGARPDSKLRRIEPLVHTSGWNSWESQGVALFWKMTFLVYESTAKYNTCFESALVIVAKCAYCPLCLSDCCWVLVSIRCSGYQGFQLWNSFQLHWVVEAPGCFPDQSHRRRPQTVTIANTFTVSFGSSEAISVRKSSGEKPESQATWQDYISLQGGYCNPELQGASSIRV